MHRAGLKPTLHRTCRGDGDKVIARQESQCRSHGSDLQDLQQQFQGLSEGRGSVPAAAAFGGLDRLVNLIFSANLHLTRYKLSICWSSSSVWCRLWAEGISGGSGEQTRGERVSSHAQHTRGWAGERLQQSLVCSCSLCWGTQGLKPGQMILSWTRVKSQGTSTPICKEGGMGANKHTGWGHPGVCQGGRGLVVCLLLKPCC